MIVWTVANQKGGVGKTTTVVSLAGILAQRGQRVLLIDTDPHASLTAYLDFDSDRLDGTLYELFQAVKPTAELVNKLTLRTKFENIHLLPASITLATLDRVMGNREGMGLVLKRALLRIQDQYDYVLIDSPPVLAVSDTAIIAPLAGTKFMVVRADVSSLGEVQEAVKRIAQSGETVKGIIFNGLDISKRRYGYGYGYGYGYKYKRYGYRYQSYNYGQDKPKT